MAKQKRQWDTIFDLIVISPKARIVRSGFTGVAKAEGVKGKAAAGTVAMTSFGFLSLFDRQRRRR